eukprot:6210-Prymnesium_polylepis.1
MLTCPPSDSLIIPTSGGALEEHGGYILVDKPAVGYWIAGSGCVHRHNHLPPLHTRCSLACVDASHACTRALRPDPVLNGIYTRRPQLTPNAAPIADAELCYWNMDSGATLSFVTQGWLLCLPLTQGGLDCFLQMSTSRVSVASHGWQQIYSDDIDPLADPPDEVVALLDEQARARARSAPPCQPPRVARRRRESHRMHRSHRTQRTHRTRSRPVHREQALGPSACACIAWYRCPRA